MQISVIIPTLNRPAELRNALDSIVKQNLLPSEIIVVDQSGDDITKEVVSEYRERDLITVPKFIYLHQKEKSSAKARNYGLSRASGDIICFTDDDVVLFDDYLEKAFSYFKNNEIGGVSGNVVNPVLIPKGYKSMMRILLMRIFLISNFRGKMTVSGFGYPIFERQIHQITFVELLSGYSMIFRRKYLEYDRFDEWFSGYSFREDVELSYRISKKTKLVVVPDVKFIHNNSPTNRADILSLKKMQFKNYYYVFRKHKFTGFLSHLLFFYSLTGIILIDFIECVLNFKSDKLWSFRADLKALRTLLQPAHE